MPGGVTRGIRGEERRHVGDFLRCSKALQGQVAFDSRYPIVIEHALFPQPQENPRFYHSNRNAVGANIMAAFFLGDALDQFFNGRLGRDRQDVQGRVAQQAGGTDMHVAAAAALPHGGQGGVDGIESPLGIGPEHALPQIGGEVANAHLGNIVAGSDDHGVQSAAFHNTGDTAVDGSAVLQ